MIARPDADALLAGELGSWLSSQNADRAATKAKVAKIQMWAIVAACVVAGGYILVQGSDIVGALQFGFFAGMAGFGIAAWAKRPMLTLLKSVINGAIARALELDYSASVTPGRTFERAKAFEMVPGYDDENHEDLWWGALATSPFTLHETKLTEERGSGKSRHTVTVFEGSIVAIGFTRNFSGVTLIERKSEHRGIFGGQKDRIGLGGLELSRVDMVDPRFEDAFSVWSNDGVEARYLVHPEYAERLTAIEQAYGGEKIRALFCEGELLIVIETGNLFESGSLEASDDRALVARTIEQFGSLADLAVKLNERERAGFN